MKEKRPLSLMMYEDSVNARKYQKKLRIRGTILVLALILIMFILIYVFIGSK